MKLRYSQLSPAQNAVIKKKKRCLQMRVSFSMNVKAVTRF